MAERAVSVPTSVIQLASFNPRRTALAIYNNGTETVALGENQNISTANGMLIPVGSLFTFDQQAGDDPRLARFAISPTIDNDVRVYEAFAIAEA